MSVPSQIPHSALAQRYLAKSNAEYEADVSDSHCVRLSPAALMLTSVIWAYRTLLPNRLKRKCIYTPTCSLYMLQALRLYGAAKGLRVGIARIRRCNGALYQPGSDPILLRLNRHP
jgi:putative membrane protein insertion efficiency factor